MDRQPPFDLQAEIGVLGSIVLLPDVLDDVVMIVRPDDFYDEAHRKLFVHMTALHETGKKIDDTLLVNRLKTAGDYESIGGAAYLSKIVNAVPNAAHATYYAEIVREKGIYRSLILKSSEILRDAYDESAPAIDLLGQADNAFAMISEATIDRTADSRTFNEALLDAMDALRRREVGEKAGIESGFGGYDDACNGMKPGDLIILAGAASMGKSACAGCIAEHVARSSGPVLFISLEMRQLELVERFVAQRARVNYNMMSKGMLTPEERTRIVEASGELSHLSINIDDHGSMTVAQIAARARRMKRRGGLALIVVDYLQLIDPDNPKDSREEQVGRMARRLKMLARDIGVPILCLCQVNRQVDTAKDFRPRLSHLRESGAIEQHADHVLFVHRPLYYRREHPTDGSGEQAELILAKIRNGPIKDIPLLWFGRWMRWENPAGPQFAEHHTEREEKF